MVKLPAFATGARFRLCAAPFQSAEMAIPLVANSQVPVGHAWLHPPAAYLAGGHSYRAVDALRQIQQLGQQEFFAVRQVDLPPIMSESIVYFGRVGAYSEIPQF
jgi:hypothetical protein